MPAGQATKAIVLGGGLAGMLAASVLTRHVDTVTVIERDRLPDGPVDRKGTPQTRHAHVLVAGGARALDELLPGITASLFRYGAQYIGMPNRFLLLLAQGWLGRWDEMQFLIGCSRSLLDWVVRERVMAETRINVMEATDAVGLTGDANRVTGALIRDRQSGRMSRIDGDFVVDATGRLSDVVRWLSQLGLPETKEDLLDPQLFYSSRIYAAPPAAGHDFPQINVASDLTRDSSVQSGILVPIEHGRWIVSLTGSHDRRPPTDESGFAEYARGLRHPIIGDLTEAARPLTKPRGARIPGNQRRRFDQLPQWPQGFAVLGDAACTFNPVYGHGMTIAARGALALDTGLLRYGLERHPHRIQREIMRAANVAWKLATSRDLRYTDTIGATPGALVRLQHKFLDRLVLASASRPAVAAAQLAVYTLADSPSCLLKPRVLLGTLLGPRRPARSEPPLTEDELRARAESLT